MQKGDISLKLNNDRRVHLFVKYGMTLSYELALHMFYMSKGSSGLKCCVFAQMYLMRRPRVRTFAGTALR